MITVPFFYHHHSLKLVVEDLLQSSLVIPWVRPISLTTSTIKIVFRVESEWLPGMLGTDYGLYFNSKVLISIHSSEGQTVLMGNPHSLFSEAFGIPTHTDSFLLEVISDYIVLPQLTYRNYRRLRLGRPSLIFSRLIQLKTN